MAPAGIVSMIAWPTVDWRLEQHCCIYILRREQAWESSQCQHTCHDNKRILSELHRLVNLNKKTSRQIYQMRFAKDRLAQLLLPPCSVRPSITTMREHSLANPSNLEFPSESDSGTDYAISLLLPSIRFLIRN